MEAEGGVMYGTMAQRCNGATERKKEEESARGREGERLIVYVLNYVLNYVL